MFNDSVHIFPRGFKAIQSASQAIGFSMPSDLQTGALLQTLVGSKPKAHVLEIGTGTGLATAWLLAGMDGDSTLVSIDSDPTYLAIAQKHLGGDYRLTLVQEDAEVWLSGSKEQFDLIFADAWPGKYANLDQTLNLLKRGGLYVIDDMLPQPNWPEGHQHNVDKLVAYLENRVDVHTVRITWSTGIMIATKK